MDRRQFKMTRWLVGVLVAVMFVLMASNIGDARAADSDGQWVADIFGWRYQYADGTYAKDDFERINGKRYAFDENGYMQTGWIKYEWYDGDVWWYYADGSGAFVSGWQQISGTWYYFTLTGRMAADEYVDNGKYYVNASGAWVDKSEVGQWVLDAVGWWYRYADGSYPSDGIYCVDGDYYGFNEAGYMVTGWYQPSGTSWFYFDGNGQAAKGWRQINNIWYYFADNGYMYKDEWIGNDYVDANGAWQLVAGITDGQWVQDAVGWWYRYADGTYPASGICRINGNDYCFDENGYMRTGWVYSERGEWYYFDASGAEVYGWHQIDGTWYYFYMNRGDLACNEYIDGYYVDESGAWTTPPSYAK